MTGQTSYHHWLAPLMAPRFPSSYLAAATSFISCLPLITAAPMLASKYSMKVSWRKNILCVPDLAGNNAVPEGTRNDLYTHTQCTFGDYTYSKCD